MAKRESQAHTPAIDAMSHDRDHDHRNATAPPKEPAPLVSRPKPDRVRTEHPSSEPAEPVDPRTHPSRTGWK